MKAKNLLFVGAMAGIATLTACNSKGGEYQSIEGMERTGRVALVDGTDTAGTTWDPVTATAEVKRVLSSSNGELVDVVLSNNDGMAIGIMADQTFKDSGVPIFGVDALKDALTAVAAGGQFAGTIKNDSYTQAGVAVQLAKNLLTKQAATANMEQFLETEVDGHPVGSLYTNEDGKVVLEEGTKALRVHHLKVTKANVADLFTPTAPSGNTLGKAGGEKLFALTYQNSDPNMSTLWKAGFNDYGKTAGYEIQWTDGQGKEEEALRAVTQAATSKTYKAYFINPVDNTNLAGYIKAIRDNDPDKSKPIIVYNREGSKEAMATDENVYYVGIDSAEGGVLQGEMAAEYIIANGGLEKFDRNGDGRIGYVVVRGEKGHPDAEARTVASPANLEKALLEKYGVISK